MNVIIESGTTRELSAINTIYNHYINTSNVTFDIVPWSELQRILWFEQFQSDNSIYHLLVAKIAGEVVGFAYNSKFKEKAAYITSSEVTVYIKPGAEGKGLGGILYQALLSKISGSKHHRLYAAITLPNVASIALHQKFGFELVGTMKEVGYKQGQFHSTALLEKSLNQ